MQRKQGINQKNSCEKLDVSAGEVVGAANGGVATPSGLVLSTSNTSQEFMFMEKRSLEKWSRLGELME
ncbi:hypothetical protein ACFLV6_00485 [Chloroflexota bacterium]